MEPGGSKIAAFSVSSARAIFLTADPRKTIYRKMYSGTRDVSDVLRNPTRLDSKEHLAICRPNLSYKKKINARGMCRYYICISLFFLHFSFDLFILILNFKQHIYIVCDISFSEYENIEEDRICEIVILSYKNIHAPLYAAVMKYLKITNIKRRARARSACSWLRQTRPARLLLPREKEVKYRRV